MMQVLQYIAQHDNDLTLSPCCRLRAMTALCSTVRSASGGRGWKSLSENRFVAGVYNLAGFITTASGQRMAFVHIFLAMQ